MAELPEEPESGNTQRAPPPKTPEHSTEELGQIAQERIDINPTHTRSREHEREPFPAHS